VKFPGATRPKNERANIDDDEPEEWRHIGRLYRALDERRIAAAITAQELMEVHHGEKD
jgi:hypothetical protein